MSKQRKRSDNPEKREESSNTADKEVEAGTGSNSQSTASATDKPEPDRSSSDNKKESEQKDKQSAKPAKKAQATVDAGFGANPLLTLLLVVVNISVFLLMYQQNSNALMHPSQELLFDAGADYGPLVAGGQWWRMLTSGFVHIGVIHLLLNMSALWNLGGALETRVGLLKFAFIYLISLISASFVSVYYHPYVISAGASGAIFGLLGCQIVMIFGMWRVLPKSLLFNLVLGDILWIALYLIVGCFFPFIDNYAHLGGLIGGMLAAAVLMPLRFDRKLPNLLNLLGAAAIIVALITIRSQVVQRAKQATIGMTVYQTAQINNRIKKGRLPFWLPARIGSPVELLGSASLQVPDYDTAIKMANKELQIDSSNAYLYYDRALVQDKFNHQKEALEDVTIALHMVPTEYNFAILKAKLELKQKRFSEALADADKTLRVNRKEHAEAHDLIGCIRMAQGNRNEALASFNRALADDSSCGAAFFHRAIIDHLSGNALKSQQDFIRAQDCSYVPDAFDEQYVHIFKGY